MNPPKARRITPLVTIHAGMARHFFKFFRSKNGVCRRIKPNQSAWIAIRWQGASLPCALAACQQTFKILAYRVCLRRLLTCRRVNLGRVNSGTMAYGPPQQGSLGCIHDFFHFWVAEKSLIFPKISLDLSEQS